MDRAGAGWKEDSECGFGLRAGDLRRWEWALRCRHDGIFETCRRNLGGFGCEVNRVKGGGL